MTQKQQATLEDIIVAPGDSILDTMKVIDRSGLEIALVCEDDRKLVAVATDGDIRRAIIAGKPLTSEIGKVANVKFTALVRESTNIDVEISNAFVQMTARSYKSMPVVDKQGRLVDLHSLRTALTRESSSWAVVMAGGKGERLGELTQAIPKPMLPIGDRPILEHIIQHLVSHGIRRIFLSVNHYGSQISNYFGDGARFLCHIDYLWEEKPLGTGGPLSLLPQLPKAPLIVMNGDLLTNANISRLLAFHRAGDFKATVALREHVVKVPFGVAELDGPRVSRLVEKPTLNYRINAGIYALDPAVVARVPKGRMFPITELLDDCLKRKEAVGAYHMQETWNDIGLPAEYERSQHG